HRYGIKHGGDHLAFDLLCLFHEVCEAAQRSIEHTPDFSRSDHVYVKPVKYLWMLLQGFGERVTALDGKADFLDDFLESQAFFLSFKHAQATQQRQACLSQGCQFPGKT